MAWVRIDDEFPDHRKIAGLSNDAFCLHVTAMCWVAKQQTDGKLPSAVLRRLAWRCQDPAMAAAELETAGVWDKTLEGWEIHDFLTYNPTKEQIIELAAKRSEAGKAGAMARWQDHGKEDGKTHGKEDGKTMPPSPFPFPPSPDPTPKETATPSAGADKSAPPALPASLPEWQSRLKDSKNRPADLVLMFCTLYPAAVDAPDFGYIGKVANKVGGAGRLAELLWRHSAKPPSGDVLAYILESVKQKAPGRNGNSPQGHNLRELLRLDEDD